MSDFRNIFTSANKLLTDALKKELRQQGHFNTGALESSFFSNVTVSSESVKVEGYANNYAHILDDGVAPEKASMKQFYFVKQFFISKGYDEKKAGTLAAMTIRKWMTEGMSTKASIRFSKNGRRLKFIELVAKLVDEKLDKKILNEVDKIMEKTYRKQKSETI